MSGLVGNVENDDDQGMLDNPPGEGNGGGKGGAATTNEGRGTNGRNSDAAKGGNQDLWLLTFFFKGCALLW